MGIAGLLPLLKSICKDKHISHYAGHRVAIDAYSWIHKGIYGSALDIYMRKPTRRYLDFCLTRAKLLLEHKITPILVFDGDRLPMKAEKEADRQQSRSMAREQVDRALRRGDTSTAWQYANKCVDVTPEMAHELILELQAHGIEYIVAPYEADAQMAYMFHTGLVDAIITEDSDLVIFGCKKILFKMQPDGLVSEFSADRLPKVRDCNLAQFSLDMLRHMCILSGCDYLDSIPKMGLKTAHRYISAYHTPDRALNAIKTSGSFAMPLDYEKKFYMADMAFLYQRVYDPRTKQIVSLMPFPDKESSEMGSIWKNIGFSVPGQDSDLNFLGALIDQITAEGIALGKINPISRSNFVKSGSQIVAKPEPPKIHVLSTKTGRGTPDSKEGLAPTVLLETPVVSPYFSSLPNQVKCNDNDIVKINDENSPSETNNLLDYFPAPRDSKRKGSSTLLSLKKRTVAPRMTLVTRSSISISNIEQ
jgi:exonuclease-1